MNRTKNKEFVNAIESRLSDLKDKIKEMSGDESKIEKLYKIKSIAKKILEFNRQNQERQGLKILVKDQNT